MNTDTHIGTDTHTETDTETGIVSDLVAALESAWNDADGQRFGAAFADDADFVDIRGTHHRGRATIAHGHQAIFDTIYSNSTVHYSVLAAHPVTAECVLGVVRGTLDAPGGPLRGVHESTATVLALNDAGTWRIRSFHNTLVAS